KSKPFLSLFLIASFALTVISFIGLNRKGRDEPWNATQLLAPADLAQVINDPKAKQPILFSIGPGALVKGSIDLDLLRKKKI
ncbi:MAG TPA: hypothetical protein VK543_12235, partial [Puia sp.]|nr:hypothetical protein [Puia sp.]